VRPETRRRISPVVGPRGEGEGLDVSVGDGDVESEGEGSLGVGEAESAGDGELESVGLGESDGAGVVGVSDGLGFGAVASEGEGLGLGVVSAKAVAGPATNAAQTATTTAKACKVRTKPDTAKGLRRRPRNALPRLSHLPRDNWGFLISMFLPGARRHEETRATH